MVRQLGRSHRLLEKSENFYGETLISHTIRTTGVCFFVLLTSLYKRDGSSSTHICQRAEGARCRLVVQRFYHSHLGQVQATSEKMVHAAVTMKSYQIAFN